MRGYSERLEDRIIIRDRQLSDMRELLAVTLQERDEARNERDQLLQFAQDVHTALRTGALKAGSDYEQDVWERAAAVAARQGKRGEKP